ncbi:molybdopterin-guanine dinucleotide biosynthesis protein A [Saccharothrix tamanrassetensis]|uniref:Molybdopterin-guanine dinucleotide biosynthesis protein A n=1 Tax=Saccharothrix tamanrassetensis TaxID=1051531 RepID=A0A841CDD2_9PSEU|nr:NTP transferase domain-containing protein [Saccharothrix tamanrassetensis]MBB5954177.1 molybdopterin-guanine dinucleotide biosynthesis protein A [Saccharothrix tamanrassetensis]
MILAGGRGSRLGGVDKASVEVAGRTLLEHALGAVRGAGRVVVVGPAKDVAGVVWAREEPPGGGPVAGVAAGLAHVAARRVVVLAVDQPGVTSSTVERLLGVGGAAVLVDDEGRPQWLAGVWETDELRAAMPVEPRGASMRSVLGPLRPAEVAALPGEAWDVDAPGDLAR